jgi:hypothetical protein
MPTYHEHEDGQEHHGDRHRDSEDEFEVVLPAGLGGSGTKGRGAAGLGGVAARAVGAVERDRAVAREERHGASLREAREVGFVWKEGAGGARALPSCGPNLQATGVM